MATDARISTALPSHPKTKKLVRQLGPQAGWSLVCLILWAASNRSDGDLSGMTDEDIELAADWDGEEGEFIGALRKIRFVDGDSGQVVIHDWIEHQPWAAGAEARSLKAKWNAVKRYHGEHAADKEVPEYAAIRSASSMLVAQKQHAKQHATSKAPACSESSPSPNPSPTPTYKEERAKRSFPPPRPDEVSETVWTDWLHLRKSKSAPVTATVLDQAKREASKAGMTLEAFLQEWCVRGSQGLKADWLRTHEKVSGWGRGPTSAEQRVLQAVPGLAAPHLQRTSPQQSALIIETEAAYVPAIGLD